MDNQPRGFRFSLAELMLSVVVAAIICRWPMTLSLAVPAVAYYLSGKIPGPRRPHWVPRYFYRLALPVCWLSAGWISWNHPGDEYGMFIVSALPASYIVPLLSFWDLRELLPLLFAAGALTVTLCGWSMDRIRVWPLLPAVMYCCGTVVLVLWSLSVYPSYQRAMSKNGSLTAYVSSAANLSLYLSVAGSFTITCLTRCIASRRSGFPA